MSQEKFKSPFETIRCPVCRRKRRVYRCMNRIYCSRSCATISLRRSQRADKIRDLKRELKAEKRENRLLAKDLTDCVKALKRVLDKNKSIVPLTREYRALNRFKDIYIKEYTENE